MKLKNIKIKVKNDKENQYVLQKHIELNKDFGWFVYLNNGSGYFNFQYFDYRAVCSFWKRFRYLAISEFGNLILFDSDKYWNKRKEKEITFEEFKKLCEEQQ